VTTTIHGSTERTTEIERLIRAELAGRARLGDTDAAEDPFRHYERDDDDVARGVARD
jgi:hypothetical protein